MLLFFQLRVKMKEMPLSCVYLELIGHLTSCGSKSPDLIVPICLSHVTDKGSLLLSDGAGISIF